MKNSDIIGNRSRDIPVCSAVPQPLRHRVPPYSMVGLIFLFTTLWGHKVSGNDFLLPPSAHLHVFFLTGVAFAYKRNIKHFIVHRLPIVMQANHYVYVIEEKLTT
jgi:hypothetical protein